MKLLITPAEVAALAFGGEVYGLESHIDQAAIISAQQKFLKPVIGALYPQIEAGRYGELLADHVKPALAQWVKYLVLPSLAAQAGAAGVVRYEGQGFAAADDKALARLMRRTRGNARALTHAMVGHVEASRARYPEYDPQDNILAHTAIEGGIVL